ncbi:SusD/RagB family nutrient-binding outer membrane lipoprotein [Polaribacter sp.]|uniref:SusD/RagB family nutrient-binding outer membrane lipoprotein n=1 Tax=Polaribacter sp. TaxID=1920175 RepID=UPI00404829BF
MMKNIYKIKVLILSAFLFAACTEGFEEINIDKNLPTEADSGQLLASTIFDGLNSHLNVQLNLTNQIMQYKVFRNGNDLDAYNFASGEGTFGSFWKAAYHVILDSNESIAYAQDNGLNAYVGAGKTINAFYLAALTELWIDVPYSQGATGLDNIQPVYDKQQDIYPQVLTLLEEANTAFASDTEGFVLGGDILFDEDIMQWRKMANSLRLRYLLRLANEGSVNAASQINTMVSNPSTYPIIESNDEAAIYDFTGVSPNTSGFSLRTTLSGLSPSVRFVNVLDGVDANNDADDDPRLAFFAKKPFGDGVNPYIGPFVGVLNGTTREVAQGTGGNAEIWASQFTGRFQDDRGLLDFVFISYAEVQFILAEARLNNWITTSTAQSYYEAGIAANLAYWDLDMPAGFLTRADVVWDDTLDALMNQKWIAMFFNNTLEVWGDYKRTGVPNLVPGPLATTVTNGVIPTRVFYPTLEQSVNAANYSAASSSIGGDIITAKHWYQN